MITSQMHATRTEVVAEHGVATGGHMLEAEAGVRILQEGGNAIDALVAAAFTGYVVEQEQCTLGGYIRLAIFWAERQEFITIDAYARVPERYHAGLYQPDLSAPLTYYGHPPTVGLKSEWGHLAAAVPGAVAGLCTAHAMFGRLPLSRVLEPAIDAADAGLPVSWNLALNIRDRLEEIRTLPYSAGLLLPHGDPPMYVSDWGPGDKIDTSDLAKTLRLIAEHGAAGFYSGPVAEAIDREFAEHGGILSAGDLARYRPKVMREKPARYRDHQYITANDQIGYEALNILDQFDLRACGPDSVEYRHLMAEALGMAFVDNMTHYGDPDFVRSPVNGLASRAFGEHRAGGIRLDRASSRPMQAADPWPFESLGEPPEVLPTEATTGGVSGTSQMAAADREGNLATCITSVGTSFGSLVSAPGTGVFLNNAMRNYDPRPGHPNAYQPGKMPIFAVPTLALAKDGRAVFGGCGSGGYRITTGVLHTLVNKLDFGMELQAAVDGLRVHCQGQETFVDSRLPADVQQRLAEMGHKVAPESTNMMSWTFGRVNAIYIDPKTGLLHAGTGEPWNSAAAGF
jgi:gamma-glutamyltranspeptidase/glutathione hydrolase